MRVKTQIIIGAIVVVWGLLLLVGNLVGIDVWAYVWPLVLIAIGVWLLTRRGRPGGRAFARFILLGDVHRRGAWNVKDEDIFCLIGDIHMDLTQALIPPGETTVRMQGFVNSITLRVPRDVGVAVSSTAFLTTARAFGHKQDFMITPYEVQSDNYPDADRKIRFELLYFVADLKVRQPESTVEG